jgi:hypothetical protein
MTELAPNGVVKTCMLKRITILTLMVFAVVGCTTLAAPPPGEKAAQMHCEDGSLKVCTGYVGSKIKRESPSCSCH